MLWVCLNNLLFDILQKAYLLWKLKGIDSEEEKKGPFMAKLSFADKKGSSNRRKRRRVGNPLD